MYYISLYITADYYLCDKNKSLYFVPEMSKKHLEIYDKFLDGIENIVMGKNTYLMLKKVQNPNNIFPRKELYVLSQTKLSGINCINDIDDYFFEFPETNTWFLGGITLVNHLLDNNLVEELQLTMLSKYYLEEGIKFNKKYLDNYYLDKQLKITDEITKYTYKVKK